MKKTLLILVLLGYNLNGYSQTLWGWGLNTKGQLGLGNSNLYYYTTPQKIGNDSNWIAMSAGYAHSIFVKSNGTIWSCGDNSLGQLGIGNNTNFTIIQRIGIDSNWLIATAGNGHSLALKKNGTIWSWGFNDYGELGLGNTNNYRNPQQIGSETNWFLVTNNTSSFAIKKNKSIWCWGGQNSYGQLGLGNKSNYNSPQQIGSDTNWILLSSNGNHTIALKKDGTLWSWGNNMYGQLGLGNTTNYTTPQKIGNDTNWRSISIGSWHSVALKSDGTIWSWGINLYGELGLGNNNQNNTPKQIGTEKNWLLVKAGGYHTVAIKLDGKLWSWGMNDYGQLGLGGNGTNYNTPQQVGTDTNWVSIEAGVYHTIGLQKIKNTNPPIWQDTGNITSSSNWSTNSLPTSTDSVIIKSGTLTVNQSTTLDIMTVLGGSTVKLEAPLTLRNLHLKNGTIDLNGQKLTVTGRIYQSTDSTNYYIQAGTSSVPKPRSELVIKPTTAANSTLYFNPNANRINKLEIGNGTAAAQITLANAVKIKGGEDGGTGPGLLTVNKNAKIIIANGSSLTLESDTFNAGLSLAQPAQRSIVCQGTGKFNIERDHFGARGWRLYAHPFKADIDLQEVANDIELIGSGGTAEGFYSNIYKNSASYWYDNSMADSSAPTDPAWIPFTSAIGNNINVNPNLWKKHSPLLLFNPGNRFETGAYGHIGYRLTNSQKDSIHGKNFSPYQFFNCVLDQYGTWFNFLSDQDISIIKGGQWNWILALPKDYYVSNYTSGNPTYEQGKINLSYTLDSTTVHLNDGTTQSISTSSLSNKSKYFFITNPFTAPVKLSRIQGLNANNVDPSFYYWKQRRNTVTNNFSPAEWQAERIFNGTALRDSNIAISAFGTILVRLKNNNTTFTIPESAKQLSNFNYIIGGAKGISKTGQMFLDASVSDVGNNGLEIKLLVNDSQEADRVLVYNEPQQSSGFTTADARKYLNQDFPNVFTLSSDGKPLALDMQDIKAELDAGKSEVAIPLAVNREANKRFPTLKWEITANTTGLDVYLRNRENGSTELWSVGDIKTIAFQSNASEIRHYELVFKRNSSLTEDLTQKPNLTQRAPMELIVYPNPVDDQLQLKVIHNNGEIPFHIYSITGVKVMEGVIKSEKTMNSAGLNAGVYVIDAGGMKVKFVKK